MTTTLGSVTSEAGAETTLQAYALDPGGEQRHTVGRWRRVEMGRASSDADAAARLTRPLLRAFEPSLSIRRLIGARVSVALARTARWTRRRLEIGTMPARVFCLEVGSGALKSRRLCMAFRFMLVGSACSQRGRPLGLAQCIGSRGPGALLSFQGSSPALERS
jgi:hypothetical protein